MASEDCFLCERPLSQDLPIPQPSKIHFNKVDMIVECLRCGTYELDVFTKATLSSWKSEDKLPLCCATRQASEAGQILRLEANRLQMLAESHQRTRVSENKEKLLQQIARREMRPKKGASFSLDHDFTLIDCLSRNEFTWYIEWLDKEGLAFKTGNGSEEVQLTLSMKGWNQAQPLPLPGGTPGRCFVAMWFAEEMSPAYYQGIEPAVENAIGRKPIRIDQKQHNNEITDEIMAEIRNAQFLIADFTGNRAGVYYEAGFAVGLNRPVIRSCRRDHVTQLHFDTSHINHVVWDEPSDLRQKLYVRIRATIPDIA